MECFIREPPSLCSIVPLCLLLPVPVLRLGSSSNERVRRKGCQRDVSLWRVNSLLVWRQTLSWLISQVPSPQKTGVDTPYTTSVPITHDGRNLLLPLPLPQEGGSGPGHLVTGPDTQESRKGRVDFTSRRSDSDDVVPGITWRNVVVLTVE